MTCFAARRFDTRAIRDAELGLGHAEAAVVALLGPPPPPWDPAGNPVHARLEAECDAAKTPEAAASPLPPMHQIAGIAGTLLLIALATGVEFLALVDAFAELGMSAGRRMIFAIAMELLLFVLADRAAKLVSGPLDATGRRHPPKAAWIAGAILAVLLTAFSIVRLVSLDQAGSSALAKASEVVLFLAVAAGPCALVAWSLLVLKQFAKDGVFAAVQHWFSETMVGVSRGSVLLERDKVRHRLTDWSAKAETYRLRYRHVQERAKAEMRARGFAPVTDIGHRAEQAQEPAESGASK